MNTTNDSTHTVLIISQDADLLRVWMLLFEQRNCRVFSETSARAALVTSRLISPTLIILNLNLPHEQRLNLCKDLRATTNGTLLLMDANYRNVDLLEYQRAGVDESISEGISPMALLVKSLAWLARHDWIVPRRPSPSAQICA